MRNLPFCLFGLICVSAVGSWGCSAAEAAEPSARKPNIVVILADDLGYGDLSCYGGKDVPTPELDKLARGGVRFTDGYVACPVCAPSRLGLMSGAYPQRFGMTWNDDRSACKLPQEQKLLPEILRAAGYKTGLVGKWNIARTAETVFDEVYDFAEWESDYFPSDDGRYIGSGVPSGPGVRSSKTQGWGPRSEGDEYLTDRMGRHAVEFIDKHASEPFFLYAAFNGVHSPWQAKQSHRERFAELPHEVLRLYGSMLTSLDENVGRILEAIEARGVAENTIVFFLGDNGPALGSRRIEGWPADWPEQLLVGSAGPLRGHKADLYEGGIRVPFIMRWPARLKAGATDGTPVCSIDILATVCAAAGAQIPKGTIVDGKDLTPWLLREASAEPPRASDWKSRTLYWKTKAAGAVRSGDWKLVLRGPALVPELFHLGSDVAESRDRSREEPATTNRLLEAWRTWDATLPPPARPNAAILKNSQ